MQQMQPGRIKIMNYFVGGFLSFLSIEDLRKRALSVWMLLIGGIGALIYSIKFLSIEDVVIGCIPGVLMIMVSKLLPKSLGMGDGVLVICYGMIYGWEMTCVWLMNSFLLVAVVGMIMGCICKNNKKELPFVPFMTVVHFGMFL